MMDDDDAVFWHLSDDLSVKDAAVLIAGGDPSSPHDALDSGFDGPIQTRGRTTFTALCNAIRAGKLRAQLAYSVSTTDTSWLLPPTVTDGTGVSDLLRDGAVSLERLMQASDWEDYIVSPNPDWDKSTINVDDLRVWLRGKGITSGFFFPVKSEEPLEVLNEQHDHFAPELAMAVTAWLALSKVQKFSSSPKDAISTWIAAHEAAAWKGANKLSRDAIERIATVANWKKSGGAPKTPG